MRRVIFGCSAAAICFLASTGAEASSWHKVMAVDPYAGGKDSGHYYDYDATFRDRSTGWVVTRLQFLDASKAASGEVSTWYLWAFDCRANTVRYIGNQEEAGFKPNDNWRDKADSLSEPSMNGVTNALEKRVCARNRLWPKGDIGK